MAKLALCVLVALVFVAVQGSDLADDLLTLQKFKDFQSLYNKNYEPEEATVRYLIFKDNVAKAEKMNKVNGGNVFGVTKFSDLTAEEFRKNYLGFSPAVNKESRAKGFSVLPRAFANVTSFDWRTKGAVTPVKDQGGCGSCWAFSTTEEIESMWFLSKNKLPVLSPQQIVSCDSVDGGCNGGDTPTAYAYVKQAGGLETEAAYPYTSGDSGDNGDCTFDKTKTVAQISGFTYAVPPCNDSCTHQDEQGLANALATHGPVSICVYAESWQSYTSGVLKSNCPKDYSDLDHCVQLVGFNKSASPPYWIIRNSWNTNWGIDGYIYVEMGSNLCGVADEATFATAA